jgi:hypothetical protein
MILPKSPLKLRFFALIGALTFSAAQAQMTPYLPPSLLFSPQPSTGPSGGNGRDADCGASKPPGDGTGPPLLDPSDGNKSIADYSYTNYTSVNSVNGGSIYSGIFYQSTGGTGGTGGYGSTCYSGYGGGPGGLGGYVTINNSANLTLYGAGIVAVSQGGRGGLGGDTNSTRSGGDGGNGGQGGNVTLTNYGAINTVSGPNSFGLYGLSQGGGGGNGGKNKDSIYGSGGDGKAGGVGGTVTLTNYGAISTTNSYAMFGISVGGYGGNAGSSNGLVPAPNSDAGYGGVGGNVILLNEGSLTTNGTGQAAMVGVSVGGGGGDAGRQSSISQFGANGGPGAKGGTLMITNTATINTLSTSSVGVAAVSVGGGGGTGGMSSSAFLGGGGSGGGGGDGGNVQVVNSGSICTGGNCSVSQAVTTGSGLAPAIAALSVGGGGGMGGYSQSAGVVGSVGVGGQGGDGGDGGKVWVNNINTLRTTEITSAGILAASVGGGGGTGGGAFSAAAGSVSMSVAVGGKGGDGGDGGVAGVNCGQSNSNSSSSSACSGAPSTSSPVNGSSIVTQGTLSPGILAMSVGGGGGAGGFAVSLAQSSSMAASVSVGGSGGSGGDGSYVYANTAGVKIQTSGEFSSGVEALSIGGGGGHGGMTMYTPDYLPGGAVAPVSVGISVGGTGGSGGTGGAVIAENIGSTITTNRERADGIFAASIGGRGGRGGLAAVGAAGLALSATTSVGGNGGNGNKGGNVTIYNTNGSITTYGQDSHAIEALSVGGGGGSGGWSAGAGVSLGNSTSFTVGGNGGSGGSSGAVNVTNSGLLSVNGTGGAGILALSIGGGGGNGGSSASADVALSGAFTATVGGSGGGGATAGSVNVTNTGKILTGLNFTNDPAAALGAQGIVAMSIGGGGGRGGIAVTGDITGSGSLSGTVGGGSGSGGTGGAVAVTNQNQIVTLGDFSNGIIGISAGGRGGLGGIAIGGSLSTGNAMNDTVGSNGGNGGDGGSASVTNNSLITTGGFRAHGVTAQSMGGHGGMGGIALGATLSQPSNASSTVSLGGSGGHGGSGGEATATNNYGASISSTGPFSAGLIAQSLGGDGGIGGIGIGIATSIISPSVTLGGSGGDGADAGNATATSNGSISTSGLNSIGMLAQSIGGNGGLSGVTIAGLSSDRAGQFDSYLGSSGGSGADGGSATSNEGGTLTTSGALSTGVAVESIGGGGGRTGAVVAMSAGDSSNLASGGILASLGASNGSGGDGGAANLTQNGNVTTSGIQSDALYAGSIGGGGGSAGFSIQNMSYGTKTINFSVGGQGGADGDGGTVSVNANHNQPASSNVIRSYGAFSNGIFAQSVGAGGGHATGLHSQSTAGGMLKALSQLGNLGGGNSHGDGGTVNMYTGGGLNASGIGSTGILGQSIGGGGGTALSGLIASTTNISIPGTNIQFTVGSGSASSATGSAGSSTSAPSTNISLVPGSSTTITAGSAASSQLGGFSAASGDGGVVNLTSTTELTTVAAMSDGIKLQSIGGGGGFSGVLDSHSGSPFAGASMFLGGGGSGGGDGGNVNLTSNSGLVSISGALSTAILAQSIGGGGGDSRLVSLAATGLTSGFAASHGVQSGAAGGSGGVVTVNVDYQVLTSGIGSDAIVAQSIGGGGGFSALYGSGATAPAFASSSSGVSGESQAGMMSNVSAGSSTSASYAGSANNNSNMGGSISTIMGASMAGVLGASGGTGNNGNTVSLTNSGWVYTGNNSSNSDGSAAMIAQSIGAGGGIVREHLANFDQSQTSMSLMLGAIGSANGFGGSVTVSNNYTSSDSGNWVNTFSGKGSIGILAQSIGGGGGLGMLTEATAGRGGSASLSFSLGGAGTSNGGGGTVIVNNGGHLQTSGDQSEAIIAQSISGGGGVAKASIHAASSGGYISSSTPFTAYSSPSLVKASAANGMAIGAKLGSSSTDNSNAGAVTVNNIGAISTEADLSKAIVAQSISGGGGVVDITAYGINTSDFIASVNMGGSAPGNVGAVAVNAGGTTITTAGNLADAIVAQSITFGGGIFGAIDWNTGSTGSGTISYQLGSPVMSSSPSASAVSVTAGNITTSGYGSSAITAQSIGGGGGLLGFVVNTGSMNGGGILGSGGTTSHTSAGYTVAVSTNGSLATNGAYAPAIIAQSIGGGGGRVIGNKTQYVSTLLVGGQGGGGGSNTVNVTTSQSIGTGGANSPGIIAQSIGGGGGILNTGNSAWTNVILGGYSASSSTVNVTAGGSIWTGQQGSAGIIAQSIGGGGGLVTMNGYSQFGGTTTTGSNASTVTVNANGSIVTNGNAAPGVIATSIGGGGGVAILSDNAAQSYSGLKGRGNGGNVTVNVNSSITTYGSGSDGVVAVSIGGGGGVVISTSGVSIPTSIGTGSAGSVTVHNNSSIHTYGANTTAIYAKALKGNEDPQVNMAVGSSAIGGAGGTGIFLSGAINVVNNSGYIGTLDGVTGRSIVSDMGTTAINNSGVTVGDITLGGSGNVINNLAAGRMYLVNHPNIGLDGIVYNSGFLQYNPNGLLGLGTLAHTGTLIQLGGGVLGVQYDHQAAASSQGVVASLISAGVGSRLELGGSISPTLIHAGLIAPGSTGLTTIISNNGGTLIHDDLGVVNTAIMSYGLVKDSSGVQLSSTANFVPAGLSTFGNQMGSAIGTNQTAGSNAFFQAATAQLVTVPTVGALDQAYSSLAGSAIQAMPQANYQAVVRAMGTVSDRMNSWRVGDSFIATTKNPRALMTGIASMNAPMTPNAPQVATGTLSADGGQLPLSSLAKSTDARTWITPFGGASNSNNLADQIYGGSLGIEAQSDDRRFIGGAAMTISQSNYTYSSSTTPATPGSATNYGAQFYFGARGQSAYVSAIGYLGGSSGNFTRQVQTLGFSTSTGVNVHSNIMGARVEAGYNLLPNPQGKATLQVTPFVAIAPTQIRQNGANEYFGSLGSGFYYGSNINTAVPVYLGTEISGDVAMGHNEVLKPFLRVSWAHDLMNNPMAMGAAYNSSTGPTLYANGTPSMGNMVILKGGAKYNWGTKVSAYATIDLEQGNGAYSYRGIGGSVGAIYSW